MLLPVGEFYVRARRVMSECAMLSWPIPDGSRVEQGDYGLVPGDTDILPWEIPGSTAPVLRTLVHMHRPQTIVELGTGVGFSTIWLARAAQEVGAHVHTVENFAPKVEIARENFRTVGVDEAVTLHDADIRLVLEQWSGPSIDFVFLDADKQRYGDYFALLLPLLSPGGVIVADNAGNYRWLMQDFVQEVQKVECAGGGVVCDLKHDNGLLVLVKARE